MGDRAMVEIKTEGGSLYVYTHWGGTHLPQEAKDAIVRAEPRWDDYPYATRIIVDQLIKDGRDEETGFGLMLTLDAEDSYNRDCPSVIVDLLEQKFTICRGRRKVSTFKELLPIY